MIEGIVLGLAIGFIGGLGLASGMIDKPQKSKEEIKLNLRESIRIAERLTCNEVFISNEEAVAIQKVCDYAKEQLKNDDDLR